MDQVHTHKICCKPHCSGCQSSGHVPFVGASCEQIASLPGVCRKQPLVRSRPDGGHVGL
ncbi:hypothetical protein DPMN_011786 [Dreissena polymorpha]|uniref:Uncharacterized protein n=1 Tax=Dreissena polymorpha TaxID=45954 RepID=A0A9D4N179_DREPO|nr:hypothetical protein DPMN_011786 [Dreissena polymorpha]